MLADKTTGSWERVVFADQADGICIAAFPNQGNVTRNVHMSRTQGDTRNRLAVVAGAAALMNVLLIVLAAFL